MASSLLSRAPLVSILVPAYNAARYLPELCQSIQAQTYPHYEVLVGDDGSTDNTASVLAPFLKDPRFRLLRWEQNRGLNQGWAILCASMRGEYWSSIGADDLFGPSFLEKRVEVMEANPQACLAHGPPELIDDSGAPTQEGPLNLSLPARMGPPRCLAVLLQHDVITASSVLVRTDVTRQVLQYFHWNWAYAPDWFFWILHAAAGGELLWDSENPAQIPGSLKLPQLGAGQRPSPAGGTASCAAGGAAAGDAVPRNGLPRVGAVGAGACTGCGFGRRWP